MRQTDRRTGRIAVAYDILCSDVARLKCGVVVWPSQVANYDFVNPITACLLGNEYCEADVTRDYSSGDTAIEVEWPATRVGLRRIVRCANEHDQPSYAHRDCSLSFNDHKPKWNDPNVTSCPADLPFGEGVDRLASFAVSDLLFVISFRRRRFRKT